MEYQTVNKFKLCNLISKDFKGYEDYIISKKRWISLSGSRPTIHIEDIKRFTWGNQLVYPLLSCYEQDLLMFLLTRKKNIYIYIFFTFSYIISRLRHFESSIWNLKKGGRTWMGEMVHQLRIHDVHPKDPISVPSIHYLAIHKCLYLAPQNVTHFSGLCRYQYTHTAHQ